MKIDFDSNPARPVLRFTVVVFMALVLVGLALSCSWRSVDPFTRGAPLDTILLCEASDEAGPVTFPHRLHHASRSEGGRAIGCGVCHHDYEGPRAQPPRACRTCHVSHDHEEDPATPYL